MEDVHILHYHNQYPGFCFFSYYRITLKFTQMLLLYHILYLATIMNSIYQTMLFHGKSNKDTFMIYLLLLVSE